MVRVRGIKDEGAGISSEVEIKDRLNYGGNWIRFGAGVGGRRV